MNKIEKTKLLWKANNKNNKTGNFYIIHQLTYS